MSLELVINFDVERKNFIIRQLLQENHSLRSINSELNTKISMYESCMDETILNLESLKETFDIKKKELI